MEIEHQSKSPQRGPEHQEQEALNLESRVFFSAPVPPVSLTEKNASGPREFGIWSEIRVYYIHLWVVLFRRG
jgi:hypothetical protein